LLLQAARGLRLGGQRSRQQRLFGYVSPERDPEYRDMVKKSLLLPEQATELQSAALLPIAKEGDIVQYNGKWPGDMLLGRIRFVRYAADKDTWSADIVPLKEGKSENVFVVDRNAGTTFEPIERISPVRSFYLRNENGYKIAFRKNSTDVILRAPTYQVMNSTYVPPAKPFSKEVLEDDLKRYEELKLRMISNTIKFAGVGAVVSQLAFGSEVSGPYLLGGCAGALYIYLLGKKTDGIGAGYSLATGGAGLSKLDETLAKSRFAVPLVLVLLLGAKNLIIDGREWTAFNILSRENFLGAVAGFLTYRVALFATEVATEVRTEDWLSVVPGSFAEGYRFSKDLKAKQEAGAAAGNATAALVPVVFVTGPKAAGRSSLALKLKTSGDVKLQYVKYLTTDQSTWRANPDKFSLVEKKELDELRDQGGLIYEGEEQNIFGREAASIALALQDFAPVDKVAKLVEGPPQLLDALSKIPTFQLLNIWISLQTKEQFIEKASALVQNELLVELKQGKEKDALASKSAQAVSELVNTAAKDIGFYMAKAPLFEYTLLNTGAEEETVDELSQLLDNSL